MNPINPPENLSRTDLVSLTLRQCALALNPRTGYLKDLAEEFDWHESTLRVWIENGRIPEKAAKRLCRRFGKRLVNVELLSERA